MIDAELLAFITAIANAKSVRVIIDTQVDETSENPVQNKAVYSYVNSSVATNTAYFRGTFNSVVELEAYSGELTNNDYAFVISTDSAGNTVYNRYKYNGTEWTFEYALNNSSFTATQWATIQSGLTAADKTQIGTNKTAIGNLQSQTSANTSNISTNTSDIAALQTDVDNLEDAIPTIDQTYDATSANAQSGAAVAQALASGKGVIGNVACTKAITTTTSQSNYDWGTRVVQEINISLNSNLVEAGGVYALANFKGQVLGIAYCATSGQLSMSYFDSMTYSSSSADGTKVGYETTYTETLILYRIA